MKAMRTHTVKRSMVMMRTLCIALVIVFMASGISYAGDRYGYVELRTLFDQYEKTKDAGKELTDLAGQKQEERDALVADIRRIKDEMVVLADQGEEKIKKQSRYRSKD